jgi:mono/diheme cytochrome c family protein
LQKNCTIIGLLALTFVLSVNVTPTLADEKKIYVPVEFTDKFLSDKAKVEIGKEIWHEQCTHCHGFKAYPGKAPKLKPLRYKPSFVYKRVTKGFRKMPAWDEVYDEDERMSIVAYVMHKSFSP